MFLTSNFTFKNKNTSIFYKAQVFFSFTKMRFSEQDVVLSDCVCEFSCLYDKRLTRQKDPRVRIGLIKNSSIVKPLEKKMKFSIKNFFSKWDQIRSFMRIWSHFLKKPLIKNFLNDTLIITPCRSTGYWSIRFYLIHLTLFTNNEP